MSKFIFIILFLFAYFKIVPFRLMINKPILFIYYSFRDFILFFVHKKYNICPTGEMICFMAHFGKGKTLSSVHKIMNYYNRYNNKKIYVEDPMGGYWCKQYITVLSNVVFSQLPSNAYIHLNNLGQIINLAQFNKSQHEHKKDRYVLLVLVDEASTQLNSRNFKSNFNADLLNTMLTSRHYQMSFFYTSQKFNLTDKLLRDVTQLAIECKKIWRFQVQYIYDGTSLENANNPSNVKPLRSTGFFIRNKDYKAYDTLAVVTNLIHDTLSNYMLSDQEILELRAPNYSYQEEDQRNILKRKKTKK